MDTIKLKLIIKECIKGSDWAIDELGHRGYNADYATGRKHAYESILRIIEEEDGKDEASVL